MNAEEIRYSLSKLKWRYLSLRLFEISLLALATFLLTNALASLWVSPSVQKFLLSILSGLIVFALRFIHYRLHKLDTSFFIRYLNERYKQLKESSDLLIRDENELTTLQQLQKEKILQQFNQIYPEIKLPHHIRQSFGIFVGCSVIYFALSSFAVSTKQVFIEPVSTRKEIKPIDKDLSAPFIQSLSISITPPAYTQLKSFTAESFNLTLAEGSRVKWLAEFSGDVTDAKILFSGRDSSNLIKNNALIYSKEKVITESGFYQIQWSDKNKIHLSDYYKIEIIKDQLPKISIDNLTQFTKLGINDNLTIEVKSSLSDDYGLKDAFITATVSKGSGEGIKFREEKLRFTKPEKIIGNQVSAGVSLNLKKLGLDPGDELYFYVEAFDNKMPVANHHRTETFFIALQDTTTEITSADDGLGVDLMPEYFRSQRQIIIDTEKLLKEKKKLTKQLFNSTSNELGYDQKVLRLRYGQFMGEEAESGIAQEAIDHEEEEETDPTKQFGHQHDTENEHNLVDQKKNEAPGHDHNNESKDPDEKEDPAKAFMHNHDDTEEATFFIQSVKAKLKAALAIMWDAELYLRLYEPEKSLPFQYKALNLLKEISNDSRIYVHRTGFDPPPLKEEKRLTADLSEVKSFTNRYSNNTEESYPAIRKVLIILEKIEQENSIEISRKYQTSFAKAGQELSVLAIEQPAIYLKGLSLLKSLADQKVNPTDMQRTLLDVRKILWKAIPQVSPSPSRHAVTTNELDQLFLQSLEELKHE